MSDILITTGKEVQLEVPLPQGVAWCIEGVEVPSPHHFPGANATGGGIVTFITNQIQLVRSLMVIPSISYRYEF